MVKVLSRDGIQRMITTKGGGSSSSSGGASMAGVATQYWVEENYLTKAFFNKLFTVNAVQTIDGVATDITIVPNDVDTFDSEDVTSISLQSMFGFWTELYVSALGSGASSGGEVVLRQPLSAINAANLGAPTAGEQCAIVWDGSAWTYGSTGGIDWSLLAAATTEQINISHLTDALAATFTLLTNDNNQLSMTIGGTNKKLTVAYATNANNAAQLGSLPASSYLTKTLAASTYLSKTDAASTYVSIAFFNRLFRAYNGSTQVSPNDTTSTIDNIKAMFGFWTEAYISALGKGTSGSDITLNQPLSAINSAGLGNPSTANVAIVWDGSQWTYGAIGSGTYLPLAGGSMNSGAQINSASITHVSGNRLLSGGILLREYQYSSISDNTLTNAPGISFLWDGKTAGKLWLNMTGILCWNDYAVIHAGNIGNQTVDNANKLGNIAAADYLTISSAGETYLQLAGGSMNSGAQINSASITHVSGNRLLSGGILLREYQYSSISDNTLANAPGISFLWDGKTAGKLWLNMTGILCWNDYAIIHAGNIGNQSVDNANKLGNIAASSYLTTTAAASTYLSKTDAASTYLSKTDAASTYLSKTDAASTYVSINFFNRLFRAYNGSTQVSPNDTTATIDNIKAMFGFWTDAYISALGKGTSGSDITLNQPLLGINNASLGTPSTANVAIVWDGSHWTYGAIGSGTYLPLAGGSMNSGAQINSASLTHVSGNRLLSGGILLREYQYTSTSENTLLNAPGVSFLWDGKTAGKLWLNMTGILCWNDYAVIHAGNIGNQTVANATTATKLQTAVTIWGQSFDGSGNVDGNITFGSGYSTINLHTIHPAGANSDLNHSLYFGYYDKNVVRWHEYGGVWEFYSGDCNNSETGGTLEVVLGNKVGFGVSNPTEKLDVSGYVLATGYKATNGTSSEVLLADGTKDVLSNLTVGNADKLDGIHASGLLTSFTSSHGTKLSITVGGTTISPDTVYADKADYLYNEPSLWGRPFDGWNDVSGDMTSVGDMSFTHTETTFSPGNGYTDPAVGLNFNFKFGGTLAATGIYARDYVTALSDERKKDIQEYIEDLSVELIAAAPMIRFTWKDEQKQYDGLHVGSIAQYWQPILPEAIIEHADGTLSMDYAVMALLSSIATARRVMNLEERVRELESRLKMS